MDIISESCRKQPPWDNLYDDDLVMASEAPEDMNTRLLSWQKN